MRVGPNIYLRKDGRWEARYQKALDENGHVLYGYVYGKTQEEAAGKRAEKLMTMGTARESLSVLASQNPDVSVQPGLSHTARRVMVRKEKFTPAYDQEQATAIFRCLNRIERPESTAFLLSLLLGLTREETAVLRWGDLDFARRVIHIQRTAVVKNRRLYVVPQPERTVPMTDAVLTLLTSRGAPKKAAENYVLTDAPETVENNRRVETLFRRLAEAELKAEELAVSSLRSTFIRNCLEANLNVETVSALTGLDQSALYRYFGRYIQARPQDIRRLDERCSNVGNAGKKRLNLLILGAGSHGHGVREIAEMVGVFHKIRFLYDSVEGPDIIGKCADYLNFAGEYPAAFPAFGDNELRAQWMETLQNFGFIVPHLVHPSAIVSSNVEIGEGSIIMAQATVNPGAKIGDACIIAPNSMVGFGASIGSFTHLDSGCIVAKNANVPEKTVVEAGDVYKN